MRTLSRVGVGFEPTTEQKAIVAAAAGTTDNLMISALAGAAKTSTLGLICQALPQVPILCLAFNKRIATEMAQRLPGNVTAKTLNSIGHSVWASTIGQRLTLSTDKTYTLVRQSADCISRSRRSEIVGDFAEMLTLVAQAKQLGYAPPEQEQSLLTADQFLACLDIIITKPQLEFLHTILRQSIKQAFSGLIDFDDQLYMAALFGGQFPKFPLVLVDEAQDLSFINHTLLKKLVTDRLIVVGDPHQSIYGFRGAVSQGMSQLKVNFSLTEMPLTTSFRCPRAVVRMARNHAPSMQWADQAPEGKVTFLSEWSAAAIAEGAAVICRNNAPLLRCALQLIRYGRGVQIVGSDIGARLVKTLRGLAREDVPQETVMALIDRWEATQLGRSKAKSSVTDRADCLRVFATAAPTLNAAATRAEALFKEKGPIQLVTGHKAKGLEWDVVYHLDNHLIPGRWCETPEDIAQEHNLEYVITTRSKWELHHVTFDTLQP
jgi:DNA helicase II / ATP-dependent DNA helicase PcrA